ncbi:LpxL/LpxP family Kdo(2)-lipid IV(A) lauroyl/palmitoleoyl acyltransferase [Gilvimarinus agarilyticus]|uniref:LpxL/LpxP family Kdo(2)-lipid IV(A) lauroyl/palmitoleoyl acyltransferase n=1 Tax=Gilvimarinus sp. 2_MG-2023 TaxID=3062666 RepID=UPI001C08A556|nr:LpxL/LpxP family Kdo(2)-lipid IV(A) lauroyl/palmitoleoyl acyltransferase [Gilvimarinus sp. 2_MG-2023]MBU2885013.1 LpxL/LpxP family Kdo(2)-lipid IV(A) lauroyl/palmitoleoyl acyltransferase [Gilvimarinus agarilyticus]MDO6569910.1 LpxL/LpxP family Kdo(2)-lipid IV(A) lauroyl/palmitoleoyl acyltransferase [Gilvimarinus sp. 2_MG-2023]
MADSSSRRSLSGYTHPKYWGTWLGLGVLVLIAYLPLPVTRALGVLMGKLFYRFATERCEITRINVALCFPELSAQEKEQRVREILRNVGLSFIESAVALWAPDRKFRNLYTFEGLDILRRLEAQGKGVMLLGGHYTSLDMAGRVMGLNIECDMVYRVDRNPLLADAVARARERLSGAAIERDDVRQMVRRLRQGRRLWYAPDQDYGRSNTVFAPFFGVPAATVTATARLARMGRAVVCPFEHWRDEQGIYHVRVKEPLADFPSGDDVLDATRANEVVESVVRRYPSQYLWVHRRFKTRPEGEVTPYPPRQRKRKRNH